MKESSLLRGKDYVINKHITIHQPTLGEIIDYKVLGEDGKVISGEHAYYSMVHTLTAIPSDMKSVLFDSGIDYEKISDYDLFCLLAPSMTKSQTSLLFGDQLDFSKLIPLRNIENDEIVLQYTPEEFSPENPPTSQDDFIRLDRHIYYEISGYLRKLHGIESKVELAGNAATKQILIDVDREKLQMNRNAKHKSFLLPLVSTLVNSPGFKYDYTSVWDLNLYAFMDSVKRIPHLLSTDHLYSGIYAGTIETKNIDKKSMNWFAEL